ncbi:hypothetical protein RGU70_16325 [Herbaspirillum sp. RTI4]|uniref:hypothetical protein n=1 Tax=Herbaspirillum sp. RTI4 TaxID=3048640 RepID=UPI002AB40AC9|nr:hypothetical protein [Herbaspirillum sp. RTI4]MDY7579882.1 hypothetical protein [Herbaspirillum sp. RTI4]MEA9983483.1 hypothetical protein [Herbaspirillum sp. RTI4]
MLPMTFVAGPSRPRNIAPAGVTTPCIATASPFLLGRELENATPLDAGNYALSRIINQFQVVPTLSQLCQHPRKDQHILGQIGLRLDAGVNPDGGEQTYSAEQFEKLTDGAWKCTLGNCMELSMVAGRMIKAQGFPHEVQLLALAAQTLSDGSVPDHVFLACRDGNTEYLIDPTMHFLKHSATYDFPYPLRNFATVYPINTSIDNFRFTSRRSHANNEYQLHLWDLADLPDPHQAFTVLGQFERVGETVEFRSMR